MSTQICTECGVTLDYEGEVPDDEDDILCQGCFEDRTDKIIKALIARAEAAERERDEIRKRLEEMTG
jgi:hypothetical protein